MSIKYYTSEEMKKYLIEHLKMLIKKIEENGLLDFENDFREERHMYDLIPQETYSVKFTIGVAKNDKTN